ncbi:hypothetical protein CONCODRAFT_49547 [Conidiobolus coronatus NRRL 28638]|uniref:Snf7-domain-containing protein n=1 Tax=Conidiobolus coronatus (strain ATCC 28846 / CBS 209.66 / NRRL 28638) TaxID=796925 RepID=A0A137P6H1_CONC2|nr:hypothetical protein CONCODRAFT_49547 [Conidiobolus coronatus NRRL 28638]|eukprot:KXN70602.1 hypothetical protein CONCODRAFT_49547 [Conidiobolus coronatus NRRL 28638]
MGNNSSKNKISSKDKVVLDLKIQRDKLKQYSKKIDLVIENETKIAKKLISEGKKDKALLALKKKKYQEKLLDDLGQQLFNLEEMTSTIEFTLVEQQVLEGLKKGNEVLNQLQKETPLDQVEKLMEDTLEAIEYQREIEEILSTSLPIEDQEALLEELEQLQEEENLEINAQLPNVPINELPSKEGIEDDESVEEAETERKPVAIAN